jgi:hypothetical protein
VNQPERRKLAAALEAARALVALLEAELLDVDHDPILDLETAAKEHRVSSWTLRSWATSGRLPATRGARGKLLVKRSDVRAALLAAPVVPKARKATEDLDVDPYDAMLASGTVVRLGKR